MAQSEPLYDVFMSYAWLDGARVDPIERALRDAGLRVWRDATGIQPFDSISHAVADALACSKTMLAYYSRTYPRRQGCQWELTTAVLAARSEQARASRAELGRRILVVNPESSHRHIEPVELRDSLSRPSFSSTQAELAELVTRVSERVNAQSTPLAAMREGAGPRWYPSGGLGSNRFVGRAAELWQVHSALTRDDFDMVASHPGPAHVQLRGIGGVGKSLLAEEYALRFAPAYPGGVFWLSASAGPNDEASAELARQAQIRNFATAFGVNTSPDSEGSTPPFERIEELFAAELARRALPYLWVVDDLPAYSSESARRRFLAPTARYGKTLITTRDRGRDRVGDVIDLDVLDADSALELLVRGNVQRDDESEARALIAELGCHPLALEVAGSALEALASSQSIASFREQLSSPTLDAELFAVLGELSTELPNGGERNVMATLLRGYELLGEGARDFLRLASTLAAEAIPADLVEAVLGAGRPFAGAVAAKHAAKRGFARTASAEHTGFLVHVLIARAVAHRERDSARRDQLRAKAVEFLSARLATACEAGNYQTIHSEVAHARFLAEAQVESPEEATLLTVLGIYYQYLGAYSSAQEFQERALDLAARLHGREHPETLMVASHLGWTLRLTGDVEGSYELLDWAEAAQTGKLGPDDPATQVSRYHLAHTLLSLGDFTRAEEIFEDLYALRVRHFGRDANETLRAMAGLAHALRRQARLARAQELERFVLETRRERLGENHPDTILAKNELAETLRASGDLPEALSFGREVLAAWTEQHGSEHPLTLTAMCNLAFTLWELDGDEQLQEARALEEKVVSLRTRLLGEHHEDTLRAMNNLAGTLRRSKQPAAARDLHARALKGRLEVFGSDHVDVFESMNNLALALIDLGELGEARQLQEQVLAGRARVLRAEHPQTLLAASNLLATLRRLRDQEAASQLVTEYLTPLFERPLGSLDHLERAIVDQWQGSLRT